MVIILLLGLFRMRFRFGLFPLFVALGVFQPIQVILSSTVYVEILPDMMISPGSTIMFTASIFAILLVYIREDATEARKIIYGVVIANLTMSLMFFLFGVQMGFPDTINLYNLHPQIFTQSSRIMLVGTITLFGDVILVIFVYELIGRYIPKIPSLRIFFTMVIILIFDTFVFTTGAFYGLPSYTSIILAGLVGKISMAVFYTAALTIYLRFIEPVDRLKSMALVPLHDIFYALTYREKYQIERDYSEQIIRESEARLNEAQRIAHIGSWELDLITNSLNCSDEVYRIFEMEPQQFESTFETLMDIIHPEDREFVRTAYTESVKNRTYFDVIHRLLLGDGSIKFVNEICKTFYDEAGNAIRSIATVQDISERKQAVNALRASEEKFRKVFMTSPDAVNINRVEDGLYVSINRGFTEIMGYSEADVIGKTSQEINLWKNPEDRKNIYNGLREHGEIQNFGATFRKKNGESVYGLISANIIDLDGATHIISVTRDMSNHKQAEAVQKSLENQLRQSQKLEAVGTMAGGIAHDFNNILQGLYLYSGIIQEQLKDGDDEIKSNFKHIIESSKRAKELVRQILTFSRKEDTNLKSLRIQYLLKDVLKLIRASTPTTVEIKENIDTSCGPILCDSTQIHQVFVNLCNNAVHAMEEDGGTLSVNLKEVEGHVEVEPGGISSNEAGVIELIVADTGHGMDAKTLDQIFDPFFTTKPIDEGTGLGLSIVYGIIKDIKGQITVESKPGEGATFRILMPICQEIALKEALKKSDAKVEALSILFVDDDKMISRAGKMILEGQGHRVTAATNGHDALELFQKDIQAYDLIITDLTMPKMTGLELGKAVRKLSKDISIILTSGNLNPELQTAFESLGFNGFVRKPWTAEELLARIQEIEDE